ncbi:MAG: LacI family DNA-binding transcriptional regulator [Phycisphaerae bacterium]|nr:LacI family DNA-binding transcriptional regulator [Phycisphaerae bacterium]
MPTTYDIAKLAKVHQSTVSRVLSGSGYVKKATAQKVRRACRKLGYVPNIPARTLRTRQAGAVAVHLPLGRELALADPFVLMFLGGIHEQAGERNFSVLLNCDPIDAAAGELVGLVKSHRADGVILISLRRDDQRVEAFHREGIPCVLGRHDGPESPAFVQVDIDNYQTTVQAVRFLHGRGHRRIGLVCESDEWVSGADFQRGARAEAGRLGAELVVRSVTPTFHEARDAARNLLEAHPETTALIATTALTVFGLLEATKQRGREIAVLGVDSPLLRSLHPHLPRIVSPIDEMARNMTAALIDLIETNHADPPQMLRTTIIDEQGRPFLEDGET